MKRFLIFIGLKLQEIIALTLVVFLVLLIVFALEYIILYLSIAVAVILIICLIWFFKDWIVINWIQSEKILNKKAKFWDLRFLKDIFYD